MPEARMPVGAVTHAIARIACGARGQGLDRQKNRGGSSFALLPIVSFLPHEGI